MRCMNARVAALILWVALATPIGFTRAQPIPALDTVVNTLTFRTIGPFRTGAWVTDIAVPEAPGHEHLYTIYAATRSGGLWKTTNSGTSWAPISDSVGAAAVGAVALAPSNASIVWMGTGDQANARSSYSGKGVFKSTDAGVTWQFVGLPDSNHIARIVIHPTSPDVVYVAAIRHLFSRNDERGVFRTTDGGKTWKTDFFHSMFGDFRAMWWIRWTRTGSFSAATARSDANTRLTPSARLVRPPRSALSTTSRFTRPVHRSHTAAAASMRSLTARIPSRRLVSNPDRTPSRY
jgi:hypothetical protein